MSDKKYRMEIMKKEIDMTFMMKLSGIPYLRYVAQQLSIHFWKPMISAVKRSFFLQHPVEVDSVIL